MATLNLFRHRFYKNDGTLNAGGKVYTYVPGTSTLKNTYTDSTAGTPNTNPIILDSKGEADIWQTGKIKVNVLQSDDTQVTGFPVDDIGYLIIGDEIHASPDKTTPVDGDEIGIWNSITQVLNRVTFANLWVWIQAKLAAPGAIGGTTPAVGSFTTLAATTISASGLITATGGQIKFPATQVPSADVNTLDDYKEGSWVPTATMSTSGTVTITSSVLTYTKIGKRVFVSGHIVFNSVSSPLGAVVIAGCPYTSSENAAFCVMSIGGGASGGPIQANISNSSTISLWKTAGGGVASFGSGDLVNSQQVHLSGSFIASN